MDQKFAEELFKVAQEEGLELNIHDDYSGRFMFGQTTFAISGDLMEIMQALYLLGYKHAELEKEPVYFFEHLRIDDLGRGVIIY